MNAPTFATKPPGSCGKQQHFRTSPASLRTVGKARVPEEGGRLGGRTASSVCRGTSEEETLPTRGDAQHVVQGLLQQRNCHVVHHQRNARKGGVLDAIVSTFVARPRSVGVG
jgi:hypothetical protein